MRVAAMAAAGAFVMCSCSSGSPSSSAAPVAPPAKVVTMVTMGGSATEGDGVEDRLHDAWPYLVYNEARPATSVLVNSALDDATVARAITNQLPFVRETKPDVVAVWLGIDDARARLPVATLQQQLTLLIRSSRWTAATRVLVADLPASLGGAHVAEYNAAIRRAVVATKAELVELDNLAVTLVPSQGLPDQPSETGHRAIADAFERVLRGS